jgi:hypothetical protein
VIASDDIDFQNRGLKVFNPFTGANEGNEWISGQEG